MTAALRALMSGVIDYAGLFPPAKLPLEEAVREYLAIRESPEAWMLGRFVIPIERVLELRPWASKLCSGERPLQLALIGPREDDADILHADLLRAAARVNGFFAENDSGTDFCSLELAMPDDVVSQGRDGIESWLCTLKQVSKAAGSIITEAYVEIPGGPNAEAARATLLDFVRNTVTIFPTVYFKFRTGGTTADAIPSIAELAGVVERCRKSNRQWKATAGLHHALRHTDAGLGVKMHGFLNLLFASVFSLRFDWKPSTIEEILADEDASHFHIGKGGIRWREFEASINVIKAARMTGFQSFGSCSFAEPHDDLKSLGLL